MTRLLLCYDVKGWAWWFRTTDLQRFAPPGMDVEIIDYTNLLAKYPPQVIADYCVLNFSWTMCPLPLVTLAKRNVAVVTCGGLLYDKRREGDWRSRVVTASRNTRRARERLPQFDGLIAVNREVYEAARQHNPNTVLVPSGVNTDFWSYRPPRKFEPPLRVGWSGQRRCNVKGLNEILRPLQKRCPQYDWRVNDRNFNEAMSREEMREWYWNLDVFLSTSLIEGTPSPPFEAAACGRPILCTNAGILADWRMPNESGLMTLAPRNQAEANETVHWFAAKLAEMDDVARHGGLEVMGNALRRAVVANYCYREAGIASKYLEFVANDSVDVR